jgi:hypothetical protein
VVSTCLEVLRLFKSQAHVSIADSEQDSKKGTDERWPSGHSFFMIPPVPRVQ